MSDSITGLAAAPDSTYGQGKQRKSPDEAADSAASDPVSADPLDSTDMRLIIEDGSADGALIYKTLDGRTGKVVQTLGRDQVLKMREGGDYVAGQVIKTRA